MNIDTEIDSEQSPVPYRDEGQALPQQAPPAAVQPLNSSAAAWALGEPSLLRLALLGLGVVTVILGVLAFWFAGSVRRMEATVAQQQAALTAVQTQVAEAAVRGTKAQASVQIAAQATVQAVAAQLAEEQSKSAAYSRIVRGKSAGQQRLARA